MTAVHSRSAVGRRVIDSTYARLLEDFRKLSNEENQQCDLHDPESNIFPERPSTPILENVILTPPKDLEELLTLIKRRTQPTLGRSFLSVAQQRELSSTLYAQVNIVWQELSELADDSRLTNEQNIELRVRMTAYVITTCQELFKYFIKHYEAMRNKEFYTDHANFTRLKVQMVSDSRKLLNIMTVRRYIANDILRPQPGDAPNQRTLLDKPLTYKRLLAASQPRPKPQPQPLTLEQQIARMKDELPELHSDQLKRATLALKQIAATLQERIVESRLMQVEEVEQNERPQQLLALGRSQSLPRLHAYETLFDEYDISEEDYQLPYKECDEKSLKFEHSLKSEKLNLRKLAQAKDSKSALRRDLQMLIEHDRFKSEEDAGGETDALFELAMEEESRMPPLISVIMSQYKQLAKARRAKMQELERVKEENTRKLVELKEEHDALLDLGPAYDRVHHEQPYVHTMQLSALDATRWKVACGRVSERQCKSFLHLDAQSTLWNELDDQLDEATIERLDRNLYAGREIREVYAGIMSTVKTDHLEASLDDAIEDCPTELTTQGLFASGSYKLEIERRESTISMTPDEEHERDNTDLFDEEGNFNVRALLQGRVMNEELVPPESKAPWHELGLQDWAKLSFIPKEKKISSVEEMERNSPIYIRLQEILNTKFRQLAHLDSANLPLASGTLATPANNTTLGNAPKAGESTMANQFEDSVPKSAVLVTLDELRTTLATMPRLVQDKMFKLYKSLVNRWMDVIDSDDYLKFLLTQDTDYLGLIFHLYEETDQAHGPAGSVSEDRSRAGTLLSLQLAARRKELEQRLDDLRKAKALYAPGQWNVNTVLMGGLGKDPSVQEVLELISSESKQSMAAQTPLSISTISPPLDAAASKLASSRQAEINSELMQYGEVQQRKLSSLQDRLEAIWSQLAMPDNKRLDMAIKYSSERFAPLLDRAVRRWEKLVTLVLQRERILGQLEQFEREAADPRRYANKNSCVQQKENRRRAEFEGQLAQLEPELRKRITSLEREFQDEVTFKGRPYVEKMQRDKIEMLFWLEEERKELILKRQRMVQQLQVKVNTVSIAEPSLDSNLNLVGEKVGSNKTGQRPAVGFDASALIRVIPPHAGVRLQPI